MDKLTAVNLEEQMLTRMVQQQQIASNPLSLNQPHIMIQGSNFDVKGLNSIESTERATNGLAFGDAMKGVLDTVDRYHSHASEKITAVELGRSDDLIGATVAAKKAQLSFDALMQVRNKMVSNFEAILKMPI
ncbi:flagellar hook-basal body complex protein FliE [Vibrio astriarenae]